MNAFRFKEILQFADQVCDFCDNFTAKGMLGLNMPLSERYRYELLKFAVFLADSDGMIETKEVMYVRKVLGVESVVQDLYNLKKRENIPHQYRIEIPEPFKISVRVDQQKAYNSPFGGQCSQILLDTMTIFGRDFLYLHKNDPSDQTRLRFQTYIKGLEDYLAHFKLLYTGKAKKFPIPELEQVLSHEGLSAAPAEGTYPPAAPASGKKKKKAKSEEKEAPENKQSLEECMQELSDMIGLLPVKDEVRSLVNLLRVQKFRNQAGLKNPDTSRHMVFVGNPGTGKTTVARIMAKIYSALGFLEKGHLVETDRSGLVKGYMGQTAIRVREVVEEAKGGVLFIDEAYSLTVGCADSDYGTEVVSTLMKAMEDYRDELVVIVAGYPDLMEEFLSSNPGFRSRFNRVLHFTDYSEEEEFEILQHMCRQRDYVIQESSIPFVQRLLSEYTAAKGEDSANGRDVRNFLEDAIMRQADRLIQYNMTEREDLMTLVADDFTKH